MITGKWYLNKADEIYDLLWDIENDKYNYPLISEMIGRKHEARLEYFARIAYNMTMYGSSKVSFDDIDYNPFN